ncbi:MAG: DNA polymerase III subunit beta [Actinobacteria bacterium]|nr:DNA polymerase III subunit beta [Actinomycetota bacterium]
MKFTVEQHALADAVNWVSRSLSNRPIMTALLGIVINVEADEVFLSGSDLETSSKVHFTADVSQPGKVLVPGKLLAEISRSLPNKPVTVQLDGTRVLVTSGTAKFTLPTLSLNEYPNLPELPESTGIIASDVFATAVAQVAVAAGRDDSLPTLTGIHVEINHDTITMAATDRYRLAVREVQWQATQPNLETSALLRARTLAEAAKSLVNSKAVSISLSSISSHERLAGFISDGKSMTSRLLDGTFPPFKHLLPQDISTTAVVEVATFLDSVRRVALVTDKTVPLRLQFSDSTLELEAGAGEEAQATEAIEIDLIGEPITIAFNPVFLADGLQAVGTPYVQISFTGSNKPAIFTGKLAKDGEVVENYRYLLMPMRYAS